MEATRPAPPARPGLPVSDHRRAISRQTWLANRARNALQRPAFIGAISVATFVMAIVSLVVVPRAQRQASPVIPVAARPDTLTLVANAAMARMHLVQADSLLAARRVEIAATRPLPTTDTVATLTPELRDSLGRRVRAVERLLARAEQAPLPSSYKALADLPEVARDPRVRPLLDSLADLERERAGFGAVGGVDPIFVVLTSRANEIGRALRGIAAERVRTMNAELSGTSLIAPTVAAAPAVDTTTPLASKDSARLAIQQATDSLSRLRLVARSLDREEEVARERATRVAPPLAMLASAFVLSAVIGFAAAFIGELRRPRVSDANELERFLGVRVLSTIETPMPSVDRGRREADRAAPPYFDPGAEGYQLAYLGLATDHPAILSATITGDEPAIAAVIGCNLAAVAADEARSTLVIDLESSCNASAALRARVQPGVVDILKRSASWPDVRVSARVGRDKTVDLVPFGVAGTPPSTTELIQLLEEDGARIARYYDAIFALAASEDAANGLASALPSPDVVYCARPGITPLRLLREELDRIRGSGGLIRGVVLWNAERPLLPTPQELSSKTRQTRPPKPEVALAAT